MFRYRISEPEYQKKHCHGCDIMVESEIEQGTKFAFEFEECVSMDEYE